MIANIQGLRELQSKLTVDAWTLAALGALYESKLAEHLREPRTLGELAAQCTTMSRDRIERCLGAIATLGLVSESGGRYRIAEGVAPALQPLMVAALRGEVRSCLMQAVMLLDAAAGTRPEGWSYESASMLQAQGDASGAFAPAFKNNIVGNLGDLAARLEKPEARFLDVGAGVGAFSIAMCRVFPQLHAVALDVAAEPLALARENIARAGLEGRIEARQGTVQSLAEEAGFDLAWLPGVFIAPPVIEEAFRRVHASIRPGGWLLSPAMAGVGDARQQAMWALLTTSWGGPPLTAQETADLMTKVGFKNTRVAPTPPFAPALIVGQR